MDRDTTEALKHLKKRDPVIYAIAKKLIIQNGFHPGNECTKQRILLRRFAE